MARHFFGGGPLLKKFAHHWYRRLGLTRKLSGKARKISPPPGFETLYTVAIPNTLYRHTWKNKIVKVRYYRFEVILSINWF